MDNAKRKRLNIDDNPFKEELLQLIEISARLRRMGLYILLCLISSIIFLAIYAILSRQYQREFYTFNNSIELIVWIYIFVLVIVGIFMLFRFSSLRNKGMIVYEELTDEIDWSSKRKEFMHRPPVQTRIIIKEFLKISDLPFTSGTNGQAFYLVLFFIVIIASIVIKALL
jgi:hypothetical protein